MRPIIVALLELRSYLMDKADLAFGLLLPIAIFALMYGAFGGQTQFRGTAYIVDEDKGAYAERLVSELKGIKSLDVELLSASAATSRLERASILLALYIPDGFSEKLASGQPAELIFRQRGNGGQEGQIVASIVRGLVERLSQEFQVHRQVEAALAGTGTPPAQIEATVDEFLQQERQQPAVTVREEVTGARPEPIYLFLPGIITWFALFAVTLNARALVEERRKGTLERLITTRLTLGQLFLGKFLANWARGFAQMLILLALSYAVFRLFTPLSFAETLVLALVYAATVSALGLVLASIARTESQATWIAVFFTMAMVMLGGTFFEITPGSVMESISRVSLNTYANDAFRVLVAQGGSLGDVVRELAVLVGVAAVALLLSRVLFRVLPGGR